MILSDHFISLNIKLTSIFRTLASQYNLSYSQYCILMKIDSSGISMSELANGLGLDKSTLTRNINVLLDRNLVNKYQDQHDLRVYKVILSDEGEQIKNYLYAKLDEFSSGLLASLDNNIQDEASSFYGSDNIFDKNEVMSDVGENILYIFE